MKIIVIAALSMSCLAGLQAGALRVGFEQEEGYGVEGATLGEGWSVSGEGRFVVNTEEKIAGDQSLRVEAASELGAGVFASEEVPTEGIRFVDLWIKAAGSSKETAEVALSLWGSSLGFVAENEQMLVAPVNGEQEVELIESGIDGKAGGWMRLTVRQDLKGGTWDLFVNGRMAAIDLALNEEGRTELRIFAHEAASMLLDEVLVGEDNPLFPDGDRDGMPDAEELAAGLYPHGDDRKGDLDRDGISNIGEMLAGTSPGIYDGMAGEDRPSLIYVDNLSGSDANDGARSYPAGASGPKASIKAAMEAAKDGDTIVIQKGRGIYEEGSRGANGKRLTIKPVSQVTIK